MYLAFALISAVALFEPVRNLIRSVDLGYKIAISMGIIGAYFMAFGLTFGYPTYTKNSTGWVEIGSLRQVFGVLITPIGVMLLLLAWMLGIVIEITHKAQRRKLLSSGATGTARIVEIENYKLFNNNTRILMQLNITPLDGTPTFQSSLRAKLPEANPPCVGDMFAVRYSDNHRRVIFANQ